MDNLEKQIQDFWENRTSPEQRHEILRELEKSGMEWKEFMQQYYNKVLAGERAGGLNDEQKSRVWQRLKEQHLGADLAAAKVVELRRRSVWLPWAAAACVLVIVAGLSMFQWGRPVPRTTQEMRRSEQMVVKTIVKKNKGEGEESLTLPDQSQVVLAPGSSISYLENFEARARNIQLEGRALFEVAKDSVRPFTVIAHGFATTALGTRFIVDATKPIVSIRLLKGKVVVNATADAVVALQRMYLIPGQELRINTSTKQFARVNPDSKPSNSKTAASENVVSLSFERTNLAAVFQRLSAYYKTPILYDKTEVQGLSFTGDFKPSDELELALKVICNVNQLAFIKESDHIVISKH
ncbi:MAG: FecR domain-containing protein [Bacteroidetes bacterium]|nr:FecR domain-containing protein [Bacteroidota bacterium]